MEKILMGLGTSPGIVKGKVKIVKDAKKPIDFDAGDILVTRITDPTMIMMMNKAGAIVCEIGGIASHPSIVSREMGIPCVVGVGGAMKKLNDGMMVEVDGTKGFVRVIEDNKSKNYPKWIDQYTRSVYRLYQGMDFRTLEPLDVFHFHPLYSDLWIERFIKIFDKFKQLKYSVKDKINYFPVPSSIRAMLYFLIQHQENCRRQKINFNKEGYKKVLDFWLEALKIKMLDDTFAQNKNIGHSAEQINDMIALLPWQKGAPAASSQLGRLYLACSNLVNGLMNDWCTDFGIEVWGPYDVSKYYGPNSILVIREFPNLKPESLWLHARQYPYRRILIYSVYKNVELDIQYIGCHTVFKGDLKKGLVKYAVVADGQAINDPAELEKIIQTYLSAAQEQYVLIKKMDFENLKQKILDQEHYQLFNLSKLVGIDWLPDKTIKSQVRGKQLLKDFYPLSYPDDISLAEVSRIFGIDSLKKLYQA